MKLRFIYTNQNCVEFVISPFCDSVKGTVAGDDVKGSGKQCIRNTDAKSPHFSASGNEDFLLVEALPQSPQNTASCSGNAGKLQRLRDYANR